MHIILNLRCTCMQRASFNLDSVVFPAARTLSGAFKNKNVGNACNREHSKRACARCGAFLHRPCFAERLGDNQTELARSSTAFQAPKLKGWKGWGLTCRQGARTPQRSCLFGENRFVEQIACHFSLKVRVQRPQNRYGRSRLLRSCVGFVAIWRFVWRSSKRRCHLAASW